MQNIADNIKKEIIIDNINNNKYSLEESYVIMMTLEPKEIKYISNEFLVELIQAGYEEMWEILYNKTRNCIHKVFHKHVSEYYKNTMEEDIYSVLNHGWTKAVLNYDKTRATANFVAYASFIMNQHYIMFARKIKPDRIGRSVRYELLDSVSPEDPKRNNSTRQKDSLVQNIMIDKKEEFLTKENTIILKDALAALKEEKEDLYNLINLHYLQGIPQTKIAEMHNHGQSYISRKIKQGIKFLQDYLLIKSKGNIKEMKEGLLSCYNN